MIQFLINYYSTDMFGSILAYSSSYSDMSGMMAGTAFGGIGLLFVCIYIFIYIAFFALFIGGTILWIIMLIDIIQRNDDDFPNGSKDSKMLWLLIILLTGYLGGIIYYFMIYKKQPRKKLTVEKK